MKRVIDAALAFILGAALMHGGECHAFDLVPDDWTKTNTKMELGYVAIATVDMFQTMDIKNHDDIHEANPIVRSVLGDNPERGQTAAYFAGAMAGHFLISRALPKGWREVFQTGTVIVQTGVVANNWALGLRVGW